MKNNSQLAMRACDKKGEGGKAMAMAIRGAGSEESDGNKQGNGVDDKGGVQQRR
jgi:hypothetical protein